MLVPVHVPHVAIEIIKSAFRRIAGPFFRRIAPALQPVLAQMDGVITCFLKGVGKIPIIFDGLVELHVAYVRVALVHASYEGGP